MVDGEIRLTYGELGSRVSQLAAHLIAPAVSQPETVVAIGLPRSAEMVVGLLAVMCARAAPSCHSTRPGRRAPRIGTRRCRAHIGAHRSDGVRRGRPYRSISPRGRTRTGLRTVRGNDLWHSDSRCPTGVRHLHVRFDRDAQGRDDPPRGDLRTAAVAGRARSSASGPATRRCSRRRCRSTSRSTRSCCRWSPAVDWWSPSPAANATRSTCST